MESLDGRRYAAQHLVKRPAADYGAGASAEGIRMRPVGKQQGIALVMALIITMVAFLVVGTTLYMVTQSLTASGRDRSYATTEECSDGVFDITRDYIKRVQYLDTIPDVFTSTTCDGTTTLIEDAVTSEDVTDCWTSVTLPGAAGMAYKARVMIKKEYAGGRNHGRIVFGEEGGAGRGISQFYRIVTVCENISTGATAENAILFRFVTD